MLKIIFNISLCFCVFVRHFEFLYGLPLCTRSQTPVPGSPFPVPRSPSPVPRPPSPVPRPPFPVPRSQFPVPRSPFPVPRSPVLVTPQKSRTCFIQSVDKHDALCSWWEVIYIFLYIISYLPRIPVEPP